ncbi:transcriptional regulator [Calothrix sp. PCC 7716]|nr:transcriptional regulator [Calothrix sp. PCC 7716]
MTITLTEDERKKLWDESTHTHDCDPASGLEQIFYETPKQLGKGYSLDIEIYPELWLTFDDLEYHDDILLKSPTGQHTLHFDVLLSGKIVSDHGQWGEGYTLICGGGIQNKTICEIKKFQRLVQVNIYMRHHLLPTFFPGKNGGILPELQQLAKDDDWQTVLFPKCTPAIQGVAQQMINCPFDGATKRIYLQGKVLELMALQLAPILENGEKKQTPPRLKPDTVARIHHARDILRARLENPPSSLELAQLVGVSDRTLRRGFQELFGTTVFNYLTERRMEQAERLLREGNRSVAEVANIVGYSHLGLFASMFKRQYGICPRECLIGKKSVS